MLTRVRKSFTEGVKNIKWIATFLAERTRVETSMAKLLYENSKLETKLEDLYRDIGRRVLELKDKEDKSVLRDFIVLQLIDEVKTIKSMIAENKGRADTLGKTPE